jgi:hypothetical protein
MLSTYCSPVIKAIILILPFLLEYFGFLEEFKVNKNPVPFENFVKELVEKEYDRMIEMIKRYNK